MNSLDEVATEKPMTIPRTGRGAAALLALLLAPALAMLSPGPAFSQQPDGETLSWADIPRFEMKGGLKAFWNVGDGSGGENARQAWARGFEPVTLVNTFADYWGKPPRHINPSKDGPSANPWDMPPNFELVVRRAIEHSPPKGIYVQDIEFPFVENIEKAHGDTAARLASGATSLAAFEEAYYKKWAEWFWLPLLWTKERYPGAVVGLYGVQPFRRDYWGVAGKDAAQIDGSHRTDAQLWEYIDPHVDFYISSIYLFYDKPDSVFYMAANVEENYLRTRPFGDRPVYAYEWMLFHISNAELSGKEVPGYLAEAMAIIPYFSGAKGVVLWGWEPQLKTARPPYAQLPRYVRSLQRVAALSDKIGRGRLVIDTPAHVAWRERQPLVRTVELDDGSCVVMAINPWQDENARTTKRVRCGALEGDIALEGRGTALAVLSRDGLKSY